MLRGRYGEALGRRLFAAVADLTRLAGLDLVRHRRARARPALLRAGAAAGPGGRRPRLRRLRAGHHEPPGRLPRPRARGGAAGQGRPAGRRQRRRPPPSRRCCTPPRHAATGCSARCRACTAALARAERALESARPGRATACPAGPGSSTRRSSPTSSGTATATFSSTGPRRGTPSVRCSCARGVRTQPAVLPDRPGHGPAGARRGGGGVRARAGPGADRGGDAVGPRGGVRAGLQPAPGALPGHRGGAGLPRPGGRPAALTRRPGRGRGFAAAGGPRGVPEGRTGPGSPDRPYGMPVADCRTGVGSWPGRG